MPRPPPRRRAVRRGTVAQIEGDLASVNGRDRTAAFDRRMARHYLWGNRARPGSRPLVAARFTAREAQKS
ncbi:hypothetical protein [Streptomyces sp. DASNCL29]|uniref:hypothetical protein n=1 Tax=Streptomyces sp. DASNCL29 TaxID=2583819 RepID=UPI003211CBE5